jgi:hypothetical protein
MLSISLWVERKGFVPGMALEVNDTEGPLHTETTSFLSEILERLLLSPANGKLDEFCCGELYRLGEELQLLSEDMQRPFGSPGHSFFTCFRMLASALDPPEVCPASQICEHKL